MCLAIAGQPAARRPGWSRPEDCCPAWLQRHRIEFLADDGQDLEVEATFFIARDWPEPSVLGYTGVLDRIRFAIDPQANRFYFGGLD